MSGTDISTLAASVVSDEHYAASAGLGSVEHILELALKNKLALTTLGGDPCVVDLGNGFSLLCRAKKNGESERVSRVTGFDLVSHLHRQRAFSLRAFGPGTRTQMVLDHIRKELLEVEGAPGDLTEWVDLVLLALDGAWRAGHEPEAIAQALADKQGTNELRRWPDWRNEDPAKAIEHVRGTTQ